MIHNLYYVGDMKVIQAQNIAIYTCYVGFYCIEILMTLIAYEILYVIFIVIAKVLNPSRFYID